MADAVTSQTLFDDGGHVVMKFTNVSDGTGESAVTKVDVSALVGAPTLVCIEKIAYHTDGMGVNILWDATADVLAFTIGSTADGVIDFTDGGRYPGVINNAGAGVTGDIQFTTTGHTSGDKYSIVLFMRVQAT